MYNGLQKRQLGKENLCYQVMLSSGKKKTQRFTKEVKEIINKKKKVFLKASQQILKKMDSYIDKRGI